MFGRVALLSVLAVLAAPSGATAETLIATTKQPTPVRASGGIAVFSLHDEAASTFRLAISRAGGAPELLPVAPQRSGPFDADIGPGGIVYARCAARFRRRCDLYRYTFGTGRETRLTRTSVSSEVAPTIWRGRIAWARAGNAPVIYTRALDERRSRRVRAIPARMCRSGGCEVDELELRGQTLAINFGYPGAVCNNGRIEIMTLTGRVTRVSDTTCGLNGQSVVGISFDAGHLYYGRYCAEDPVSCGRGRFGAFRYTLRSRRLALAQFGRRLTGWSFDGGAVYEGRAPDTNRGNCGNSLPEPPFPDCQIVLADPLTFR